MNARQRLTLDTIEKIARAADMLAFDAHNLKRATVSEGSALTFAVEQRVSTLRATMEELTDQLATLRILERL